MHLPEKSGVKRTAWGKQFNPKKIVQPTTTELLRYKPPSDIHLHLNFHGRLVRLVPLPSMNWNRTEHDPKDCPLTPDETEGLKRTAWHRSLIFKNMTVFWRNELLEGKPCEISNLYSFSGEDSFLKPAPNNDFGVDRPFGPPKDSRRPALTLDGHEGRPLWQGVVPTESPD
jgi:hypothetical protein